MVMSEVASAVQRHFGLRGAAWFELARGLSDVGLTVDEWGEFLRICGEAGTPQRAQLDVFQSVLRCIDRYGDDGYGDKPTDMSRIVYWFQHVPPARSRSPARRARRAPQPARAGGEPSEGSPSTANRPRPRRARGGEGR
jgi:hypothetical protein